jgi:hypothetical protein
MSRQMRNIPIRGLKMQKWGFEVKGAKIPIPFSMLDKTIPGLTYEILIKTDKPAPPNTVDAILTTFKQKLPQVKIKYVAVQDNQVTIQLEGSPIEWSLIIGLLPLIFAALGIIILLIAVFGIFASIPSWAWALLVVGALLFFLAPRITALLPPPKKKK